MLKADIVKGDPKLAIEMRGDNYKMIAAKEHEVILSGPADCIHGDTIIEGTGRSIRYLCEHGIAPMVQTLLGQMQATVPYLKGKANLYQVTTEDGCSFIATARHLALTTEGYCYVSDLSGKLLQRYDVCHPRSIEELCQSTHVLDARYSRRKAGDFQESCPVCSCCDDERLPSDQDTVRSFAPSRTCVQERSRAGSRSDDLASESEHSRLPKNGHLSSDYYEDQRCLCSLPKTGNVLEGKNERIDSSFQLSGQLQKGNSQLWQGKEQAHNYDCRRFDVSYSYNLVPPSKVSSVRRAGNGDFYDITVPIAHHYFAAGLIHHNTAKTWTCCCKAHLYAISTPNVQGAIVRKTAASLAGTVLKSFIRVLRNQNQPVTVYGGETPSMFIYPNGSRIYTGGMDNPDRVLSSERDFIYTCQTEELSLNDWETLATRCSGRGAVVKYPQLFGDCNPGGSRHWIRMRAAEGRLRLLVARHQDNPTLYDRDGKMLDSEDTRRRMAVLQNLTGMRKKRLFEGAWASAEGAVYDMFDANIHVTTRNRSEMRRFFLTLDEGYTNPAVILVVGEDSDGRWHVFKEFYQSGVLQETIVKMTLAWQKEWSVETVSVDESAAGLIADLNACGCFARGGKGRVVDGINRIQNRLEVAGDGKPRLTFDPSCSNCINEFESYVWALDKPKDTPVKDHDHTSDALRYLDNVFSEPTGAWDGRAVAASGTGWELPAGDANLDPIDFVDATQD